MVLGLSHLRVIISGTVAIVYCKLCGKPILVVPESSTSPESPTYALRLRCGSCNNVSSYQDFELKSDATSDAESN